LFLPAVLARVACVVALAIACSSGVEAADLSYAAAEARMLERNRDLVAARRGAEAAAAQVTIAGMRPNPVATVGTTGYGPSSGIGAGPLHEKRLDTVVRLDQLIERGGKRELRIDAARAVEHAAQVDVAEVARQQRALLATAYYDLKLAQSRIDLLDEVVALYERTLAAARTRLDAGDIARADVARIEVDRERARNDARSAGADLARARVALAVLMADEAAAPALRAVDPWPAPVDAPAPDADAIADARIDVQAAQARVAAAERARDLARSLRTRDVTVGVQVERYPGTTPVTTLGFGVSIPLFVFNDYSGEIQAAEVARHAALDTLERTRALARAGITRARAEVQAARDRLERYDTTLLPAADRVAQAAEFAFGRGASSVIDVLDARRTWRAIRLEALAAQAEHARALALLRAAEDRSTSTSREAAGITDPLNKRTDP